MFPYLPPCRRLESDHPRLATNVDYSVGHGGPGTHGRSDVNHALDYALRRVCEGKEIRALGIAAIHSPAVPRRLGGRITRRLPEERHPGVGSEWIARPHRVQQEQRQGWPYQPPAQQGAPILPVPPFSGWSGPAGNGKAAVRVVSRLVAIPRFRVCAHRSPLANSLATETAFPTIGQTSALPRERSRRCRWV